MPTERPKRSCALDSVACGGVVLEGPPLDDWLAGRLETQRVPLAGRVRRL
jgi:hypothetical protein